MKLGIFTEALKTTGLGHLMRCSAVADAARDILNDSFNDQIKLFVQDEKFTRPIVEKYSAASCLWHRGGKVLKEAVKELDIAIVDSYLASNDILTEISNSVTVKVFLDDRLKKDYPQGMILNPAAMDSDIYNSSIDRVFMLGPKYTLLRPAFWDIDINKKKCNDFIIKTCLISVGGTDKNDLTQRLMQTINKWNEKIICLIIIGPAFENQQAIEKLARPIDCLFYSPDAAGMVKAMQNADIAITAGGQTTFELARCQVPMITFQTAENQSMNLKLWQNLKACLHSGVYSNSNLNSELIKCLDKISKPEIRKQLSQNASAVVDGQGPRRLIHSIQQSFYNN